MSAVYTAAKGLAFSRFAKAIAVAGKDGPLNALAFAEGTANWRTTPDVVSALKTAVDSLGTDAGLSLPRPIADDFLELVRPRSVLDRITGWRRVPMNTSVLRFSSDCTAYVLGQAAPAPLSKFQMERDTLEPQKIVATVALTDESFRRSSGLAELSIGQELGKSLATQGDRQAFDPNLSNSIAANGTIISSSGTTLAAIDADLKLMIEVFASADSALDSAAFVMSATTAAYLGSLRGTGGNAAFPNVGARGGSILQIPVYVSAALRAVGSPGESQIVLVDPTQVLLADEGMANVVLARSASIQMDDAPSASAANGISLFQLGLIALRAERWLSWKATSTSACVTLDNVTF